ncbi:hypothetical protein HDK77DRAFT_308481 [Phyllosticta capitalensis]
MEGAARGCRQPQASTSIPTFSCGSNYGCWTTHALAGPANSPLEATSLLGFALASHSDPASECILQGRDFHFSATGEVFNRPFFCTLAFFWSYILFPPATSYSPSSIAIIPAILLVWIPRSVSRRDCEQPLEAAETTRELLELGEAFVNENTKLAAVVIAFPDCRAAKRW